MRTQLMKEWKKPWQDSSCREPTVPLRPLPQELTSLCSIRGNVVREGVVGGTVGSPTEFVIFHHLFQPIGEHLSLLVLFYCNVSRF